MESKTQVQSEPVDPEWILLVQAAKYMGLTQEEIREFIREISQE